MTVYLSEEKITFVFELILKFMLLSFYSLLWIFISFSIYWFIETPSEPIILIMTILGIMATIGFEFKLDEIDIGPLHTLNRKIHIFAWK